MKPLLPVLLLAASLASAALSPEMERILAAPIEVTHTQNFDNQAPGEFPKEWTDLRKLEDDDLEVISNAECVSAPCSMLLDTPSGSHGYFRHYYPAVTNGFCVLSFAFRLDEGSAYIEVRNTGKSCHITHAITFQDTLQFNGYGHKRGGGSLGILNRFTWYRLTAWLPTPEQNLHRWAARLDSRAPDGTWTLGTPVEYEAPALDIDGGYHMFNFCSNKGVFYLDDIVIGYTKAP